MYANMCGNMNGITPITGVGKTDDCKEVANSGKETSSTEKSEIEKTIKAQNDPFSVSQNRNFIYNLFLQNILY